MALKKTVQVPGSKPMIGIPVSGLPGNQPKNIKGKRISAVAKSAPQARANQVRQNAPKPKMSERGGAKNRMKASALGRSQSKSVKKLSAIANKFKRGR